MNIAKVSIVALILLLTCRYLNCLRIKKAENIGNLNMLDIQTHMDFVGQAKAERWSRLIITFFGVIGLVYGAFVQQFSQTVYILGVGFVLSSLITIPPWPFYRSHPLKWQKPVVIAEPKTQQPSDSADEGKKKKK